MGLPLVEPVLEHGTEQMSNEKTSNEKASISSNEFDGVHEHQVTLSVGRDTHPCLEESIAWADAQYGKNTIVPEGDKYSSQEGIQRSPLRWFWGPESPALTKVPDLDATEDIANGTTGGDIEKSKAMSKALEDRRALRKVTAFGAFALITTDILGPFNTGYAYSTVGYVPGVLLYVAFGIAAYYSGSILSALYLRVDSDRYPVKSYGQLMARILGPQAQLVTDILMIIQFVVNCGTLLLTNAQSLEQIIAGPSGNGHLCFVVCILIFLLINYVISPIRTLKGIGYPARAAVVLNVSLVFITIAFLATGSPNYAAAKAAYGIGPGPVQAVAFVKAPLESKVNGAMNMVFAWAGAQIFVDFMAEMKRPWDFWKAMSCAQMLIGVLYVSFGAIVYALQGQFTQSLAYYGVSKYPEQTVGNVIAIITGVTAALLYGNIVQKLCYSIVVERWLNGPALMSRKGWFCWMGVNSVFWPLAFIVGTAVPQVQTISGLIAAIGFLQFTYTFPFLMRWAFDIQVQAMHADPPFTIGTRPQHIDSWTSLSRWRRGFFSGTKRQIILNGMHVALFLASIATACLGMYGSGEAIKVTFETSAATSFGCAANV